MADSKIQVIRMPKVSPTMEFGVINEWSLSVGADVKIGDVIAEIETDKAIMEIESVGVGKIGYLADVLKKDVPVNAVIGFIVPVGVNAPSSWEVLLDEMNTGIVPAQKKGEEKNIEKAKSEGCVLNDPSIAVGARIFASPLAKKIAEQSNIDLVNVIGTGPNGRIIKVDVEKYHQTSDDTSSKTIPSYEIPITPMRRIIAERLTKSKQEIPHVYLEKKICMDNVESVKERLLVKFGEKISLTPFFIKAIGLSLRDNPIMNRAYENGKIIQHSNFNVNVAIAVNEGLVTPVIKNADMKGIKEIASELLDFTSLAKNGKLKVEQMQDGTFSISNLGMFGIESFSAILNPGQVGIMAIAASGIEAHFENGAFVPRKVMKCTLSCDHRVVDGADGAKFLNSFAGYIEAPEGMLL